MATYAIGDVQGCARTLRRLLSRIRFDRARDRLLLVGDLVNRGPRSLEVLRWAADQGDRIVSVLGNHDLHLLARAAGVTLKRSQDTLDDVLDAPDASELLTWLRSRPFLHREDGLLLVHAGLLPDWTADEASALATAASDALRGPDGPAFLRAVGGGLAREELLRLARAANVLTRIRAVGPDRLPRDGPSGPPDRLPKGLRPWYAVSRRSAPDLVVFGHWAAAGLVRLEGLLGLDTGCACGGTLTAVRIDGGVGEVTREPLADGPPASRHG